MINFFAETDADRKRFDDYRYGSGEESDIYSVNGKGFGNGRSIGYNIVGRYGDWNHGIGSFYAHNYGMGNGSGSGFGNGQGM